MGEKIGDEVKEGKLVMRLFIPLINFILYLVIPIIIASASTPLPF